MVKLSEIEAANDLGEAYRLEKEWHRERGIDHPFDDRDVYMRYIERLEEALQSIADNTCCSTCQEAKLVARKALAQHKQEEAR